MSKQLLADCLSQDRHISAASLSSYLLYPIFILFFIFSFILYLLYEKRIVGWCSMTLELLLCSFSFFSFLLWSLNAGTWDYIGCKWSSQHSPLLSQRELDIIPLYCTSSLLSNGIVTSFSLFYSSVGNWGRLWNKKSPFEQHRRSSDRQFLTPPLEITGSLKKIHSYEFLCFQGQ